jgi:hypothetical protein
MLRACGRVVSRFLESECWACEYHPGQGRARIRLSNAREGTILVDFKSIMGDATARRDLASGVRLHQVSLGLLPLPKA